MTEPSPSRVPEPIGEVVPGQPPVPMTVWAVPPPPRSATMSLPMAQRLVANFTHPHELICDLTSGPQLARATMSARRRSRPHHAGNLHHGREPAALVVAPWPLAGVEPVELLSDCASRLQAGGCVVLLMATRQVSIHPRLVTSGQSVGLTYLQHVIAAHELRAHGTRLTVAGRHVRVHTDVVVFRRPPGTEAADG